MNALTVQQLIDLLSEVEDKSLPVEMEGCDCYGWAGSLDIKQKCVSIMRARDNNGVSI